jgi:phosphopantothenoylcysteine decarboxylase/phosphopantothenate--cysteine ligase
VGDKQTTRPPAPARVIVGVSGGIACYKVAQVVSKLVQSEVEVTVAMTDGATRFVTPLTFQALSGRPVYSSHADVMLIAPATMDMLARLAHGRTDDVVSLIASAVDWARQPLLLAPSMNEVMWRQPSTQRNLSQLRADGVRVIEPTKGWQACRTVGMGRLAPPEVIIGEVMSALGARARGNG